MADKTTGELDAVKIDALPLAPDIYDDTLIPVEQQGEARHMTGKQFKDYGISAAKEQADKAKESADKAAESERKAKESEDAAAASAGKAKESEDAAADSAAAALASEQAAKKSEENAAKSEQSAAASAAASEASAQRAETAAENAVEEAKELLSGYVSDAQTAEQNAEAAQGAAEDARNKAQAAQKESETARDAAQAAQGLAEAAQSGAEAARDKAEEHSTAAGQSASEAAHSAETAKQYSGKPPRISDHGTWEIWDAEKQVYEDTGKKSLNTWDKTYESVEAMEADKANQPETTVAIISSDVETEENARVYIMGSDGEWHFLCDLSGMQGVGIASVLKTEGTGKPGTTDTYTVTLTDNRTYTFTVYNGRDGEGKGDMLAEVYDPDGDGKVNSADEAEHAAEADHATSADKANEANHLTGFNAGRTDNVAWGIQTGTTVYNSGATSSDSGAGNCDFEFRKDCPSGGKMSLKVDGEFYANEGQNRCYHEGDVIPEATHATKADTATEATHAAAADTATKLGTETVGSATIPIYLDAGVPKAGSPTSSYKPSGTQTQVLLGDGTPKNITELGKVASATSADNATHAGSADTATKATNADNATRWVPERLAQGTDLDTLQTGGRLYFSPANVDVATMKHCPTTNAFALRVYQAAGVIQELTEYMTTGRKTYQRSFYSGAWGDWCRLYTTIDPPAASPVNSGTGTNINGVLKGNGSTIVAAVAGTDYISPTAGYVGAGRKSGSTVGDRSTAEGGNTTASGDYSHAEGYSTTASGFFSHAEESRTTASGVYSHAEGSNTTASGVYSHAEGDSTKASVSYSHAEGLNTTASGISSHAEGKWNNETGMSNNTTAFVIGNGSSSSLSNAFRVTFSGTAYASSHNSSGADYAEYFEWADGNPDAEDRVGRFVVLDGETIRLANKNDTDVLGIVSAVPAVLGDTFDDQWQGMFETDVFGRTIWEDVEMPEETDHEGNVIIPARTESHMKVSSVYDNEQKYKGRGERPEWAPIGFFGKLIMIDDGTAEVNGYVKTADEGIATKSEEHTMWRVMKRIDETHIKVLALK